MLPAPGAFPLVSPAAAASRRRRERGACRAAKPVCTEPAAWQRLANRIEAPVYCPGWLPDPLTAQLGAQ